MVTNGITIRVTRRKTSFLFLFSFSSQIFPNSIFPLVIFLRPFFLWVPRRTKVSPFLFQVAPVLSLQFSASSSHIFPYLILPSHSWFSHVSLQDLIFSQTMLPVFFLRSLLTSMSKFFKFRVRYFVRQNFSNLRWNFDSLRSKCVDTISNISSSYHKFTKNGRRRCKNIILHWSIYNFSGRLQKKVAAVSAFLKSDKKYLVAGSQTENCRKSAFSAYSIKTDNFLRSEISANCMKKVGSKRSTFENIVFIKTMSNAHWNEQKYPSF